MLKSIFTSFASLFVMSGISFLLLLFTDGRFGNIYLILQIVLSFIIIIVDAIKVNISNIILSSTAIFYELIYFLIGNSNIYDFFHKEGTGHYYSMYSIECYLVSVITTVILIAFNFIFSSKKIPAYRGGGMNCVFFDKRKNI